MEIMVDCCSTGNKLAYHFIDPFRDKYLKKIRDIIMGYKHIGTFASADYSLKEPRENHIQSLRKKHQHRDHMLT